MSSTRREVIDMADSPQGSNSSNQENHDLSDVSLFGSSPIKGQAAHASSASKSKTRRKSCSRRIDFNPDDEEPIAFNQSINGARVIHDYKTIISGMKRVELNINPKSIVESSKETNKMLKDANDLAATAYSCQQQTVVGYDGVFLENAGRTVNKITEAMEIDSRVFSTECFVECLAVFLQRLCDPSQALPPSSSSSPLDSVTSQPSVQSGRIHRIKRSELQRFAQVTVPSVALKAAPNMRYVYGKHTFGSAKQKKPQPNNTAGSTSGNNSSPDKQEKPKKKRMRLEVNNEQQEKPRVIDNENEEHDETVTEIEQLFQGIQDKFRRNKGNPIPYLTCVMDVNDFGKTVENIFHFSFLVKECFVSVEIVDGLARVIPKMQSHEELKDQRLRQKRGEVSDHNDSFNSQGSQVVVSFGRNKYQEWKEKILGQPDIYQIPHHSKSSSSSLSSQRRHFGRNT